ncbi:MAG: hypothetical protein KGZ30_03335 [Anaplasmataceae bacterium]|nr:hypothetical protein [Anaplasmataceae bacterium]MBS3903375.1 hypothetical protein [Anaplasmataceae bacterium]
MAAVITKSTGQDLTPAQAIDKLYRFKEVECDIPLAKAEGRKSVEELADKVHEWFLSHSKAGALIDFDQYSPSQTGHQLLRIDVKKDPTLRTQRIAEAVFSEGCYASFKMEYDSAARNCYIASTYRRGLPAWIKVGEPEIWFSANRGIPTTKVMQALLCKALKIDQYKISTISLCSLSCQTIIDVVHSMVMDKQSLRSSFAHSQSGQLGGELGEMLGGETHLTKLANYNHFKYSLKDSSMSEEELAIFKKQRKIQEIFDSTGFNFLDEKKHCYPVGFWLSFSVTPSMTSRDLLTVVIKVLQEDGVFDVVKTHLKYLKDLSPKTESRVYFHLYDLHKTHQKIKCADSHYGRKVFYGDDTLCTSMETIKEDRITAVQATIEELPETA